VVCLKCSGLMVAETVYDFFVPCNVYRCLQCGCVLDWLTYQNRQASKAKGVDMPKFQSEEHRAKWIASQKAARAAKRKKENEPVVTMDDGIEALKDAKPPTPGGITILPAPKEEDGPSWRVKTILKLSDRRDWLNQQLAEIEAAIRAVKALA